MKSHTDVDTASPAFSRRILIGGAAAGLGLAASAFDVILPGKAEAQSIESCFFELQVDGATIGVFSEVSGLGSESVVNEHRAGAPIKKVPGRLKWGDITLKRGLTSDLSLFEWRKLVEDGDFAEARKNGSIVLYNQERVEIARWDFRNAWPSKYSVDTVTASAERCPFELLTLSMDFLRRVPPPR
jgi:phage tail-like protein